METEDAEKLKSEKKAMRSQAMQEEMERLKLAAQSAKKRAASGDVQTPEDRWGVGQGLRASRPASTSVLRMTRPCGFVPYAATACSHNCMSHALTSPIRAPLRSITGSDAWGDALGKGIL